MAVVISDIQNKKLSDLPIHVQQKLFMEFDLNAPIDHFNEMGWSPLIWLCFHGCQKEVAVLLENGADPNLSVPSLKKQPEDLNAFFAAAQSGNVECLKLLIEFKAIPKEKFKSIGAPLMIASSLGHVECVKFLVKDTKDINTSLQDDKNIPPIYIATQNHHNEVIKILLAAKANPDAQYEGGSCSTALMIAVNKGNLEAVRILLEYRANPNQINPVNSFVPLMNVGLGNKNYKTKYKIAELLLKHGADLNYCASKSNNSPIMLAICQTTPKIVELLLKNNANPNITDKNKKSPLIHTVTNSYSKEIAQMLIKYNANLFAQSDNHGSMLSLFDLTLYINDTVMINFILSALNEQFSLEYKSKNMDQEAYENYIINALPTEVYWQKNMYFPKYEICENFAFYATNFEFQRQCFFTAYNLLRLLKHKLPEKSLPEKNLIHIMGFATEWYSKDVFKTLEQYYFPEALEKAKLVEEGVSERNIIMVTQYNVQRKNTLKNKVQDKTETFEVDVPLVKSPSDKTLWDMAKKIDQLSQKKYYHI